MYSDSTLSVKDATGRHISLLNDHQQQQEQDQEQEFSPVLFSTKRKYHCAEPGCNKSFTTSGHLARHHRIHTGEKNFHCLHPGCHSRFSRQDNMMQHYRTHLSPKSRRQHQQQQPSLQKSKAGSVTSKEQPRLYSRTMIGSNEHSDLYPLVETKGTDRAEPMVNDRYASATAVTRSRRATTLPSSFHPYPSSLASASTNALSSSLSPPPMQQHHHHHPSTTTSHWPPSSRFLTHSLPNLIKPLPMEPVSATSPALMATSPTSMNNDGNDAFYSTSPNAYHHHRNHYQPYHVSRRPQRAHSASSTCSSTSSSFLSPRQVNLSPPPLVDPTDVIYPKHFIQLPPPHLLHQDNQHHIVFSEQHQGEQDLLGLTHAVSIFG